MAIELQLTRVEAEIDKVASKTPPYTWVPDCGSTTFALPDVALREIRATSMSAAIHLRRHPQMFEPGAVGRSGVRAHADFVFRL